MRIGSMMNDIVQASSLQQAWKDKLDPPKSCPECSNKENFELAKHVRKVDKVKYWICKECNVSVEVPSKNV